MINYICIRILYSICIIMERCRSGRTGLPAKELYSYGYRGFESLPLRTEKEFGILYSGCSVARLSRPARAGRSKTKIIDNVCIYTIQSFFKKVLCGSNKKIGCTFKKT